jgi:hypothetical protein
MIVSSPQGAVEIPTLSFGATTPATIGSGAAGTAVLTIATTKGQAPVCTSSLEQQRDLPWLPGSGTVAACVLLVWTPLRQRRHWRSWVGAIALLAMLAGGLSGCGKGDGVSACDTVAGASTTPGAYTITVTGTSGSTSATATVSLTVQ